LIRSRRRALALRLGGLTDAVVLARLELHRLAARQFGRDPVLAARHPIDAIRSFAASGRPDRALAIARAADPGFGPGKGLALALAVAPLDPALALSLYEGPRVGLKASLLLAQGRTDEALAMAAEDADGDSRFLEAHAHRADPERAALAWAAGFDAHGLTPPRPIDASRPVTVINAQAKAGARVDGPLISVIMPSRNAGAWVQSAVRSVLAQSWRNLEFLFVDDASDDDTARLATEAAAGDPRFILISRPERGGAYRARNAGLAQARGHWIAFQDSDEWAHPERLARQVALMQARGLVATSGRSLRVDAEGRILARGVWPLGRWAPSTLIMEREPVMARAGVFDEVLSGADNEYWWRLVQLFGPKRVALSRTPLILGAWRADSLTGAADSGFGARGYNLDRLAYWERWSLWHARNLATPHALKLSPGDRPFRIPAGIRIKGS
jgi:hypothetical protein